MHLTENHINFFLETIDNWQPDVFGSLTYERLLSRFKKKYGHAPNDRTLRNHKRIKARFNHKKTELRSGTELKRPKPSSLANAAARIQKLEAEKKALERENQIIFHRLLVWQKNSMDHGLTSTQLEKPLIINKDTIKNMNRDD